MEKLIPVRSQQEGRTRTPQQQSEGAWPPLSNAISASVHEPRERKGDIPLVFQVEEGTQPRGGAFSCPTQQKAGDGWSDKKKRERRARSWCPHPTLRAARPAQAAKSNSYPEPHS